MSGLFSFMSFGVTLAIDKYMIIRPIFTIFIMWVEGLMLGTGFSFIPLEFHQFDFVSVSILYFAIQTLGAVGMKISR